MSSRRLRPGFALPAVLTVVGVVTLIFLVAMTALQSLNAEAGAARARVRFLQDAMTAEALVHYLAATEPMDTRGFDVGGIRSLEEPVSEATASPARGGLVRFDGRPYRLGSDRAVLVSLQDQAGLVNLATLSEEQTRRLASALGMPEAEAGLIQPRLGDYVDADSLQRPDGAERGDYPQGGPPNRPLRRVEEWLSLLGVRQSVNARRWRDVRPALATDQAQALFNINAAPAPALQIMLGLDEAQAAAALRFRETTPFLTISELAGVTGAALLDDGETPFTLASGRVLYAIQDVRSGWTYAGRLFLTPNAIERPLWIDQTVVTEARGRAAARTADIDEFPYTPG